MSSKLSFNLSLAPQCCGKTLPQPKGVQEEVTCTQCKKKYLVGDLLRQIKALARKKEWTS